MRHLLVALFVLASPSATRALEISRATFSFPDSEWGPGAHTLDLGGPTVPGLATFDIRFSDGEHWVERLVTLPFCGVSRLGCGAASDQIVSLRGLGGEQPNAGTLRWADLREYDGLRWATRTCSIGVCRLTISRLAQGRLFALAGFYARYYSSGSSNDGIALAVREIAVRPDPYNGYIDVTFQGDTLFRPIEVVVAYTSVPYTLFVGHQSTSTTAAFGSASVARPPGPAVLRGFRLAFTDRSRALHRFTVDVANDRVVTRLRDAGGDDPFVWSVDYLVFQE